jgi:hypothetical protein
MNVRRWTRCGECAHFEVCVMCWNIPAMPGRDSIAFKEPRKDGLTSGDTPHCGHLLIVDNSVSAK